MLEKCRGSLLLLTSPAPGLGRKEQKALTILIILFQENHEFYKKSTFKYKWESLKLGKMVKEDMQAKAETKILMFLCQKEASKLKATIPLNTLSAH